MFIKSSIKFLLYHSIVSMRRFSAASSVVFLVLLASINTSQARTIVAQPTAGYYQAQATFTALGSGSLPGCPGVEIGDEATSTVYYSGVGRAGNIAKSIVDGAIEICTFTTVNRYFSLFPDHVLSANCKQFSSGTGDFTVGYPITANVQTLYSDSRTYMQKTNVSITGFCAYEVTIIGFKVGS